MALHDGASLSDIQDFLGHADSRGTRATTANAGRPAIRRGYLERRPDPADGRARLLYLSERGEAALASARRFHRRYERRLVRTHGREAVAVLRHLLGEIARGTSR